MSKLKQHILGCIYFVLVVTLMVISSSMSYEDEVIQHQHYCKMVAKWNENKHLPPEQRPGWPPYDGECDGQD